MLRFGAIAAALLLTGCGHLRPDPMAPAHMAKYATAEIHACGKIWHGVAICGVPRGTQLQAYAVFVQGYGDGAIQMNSEACGIDVAIRYRGSERVRVPLTGDMGKDCVIRFVVSPEYPRQRRGSVVVHPIIGAILLRGLGPGDAWADFRVRLPAGGKPFLRIPVGPVSSARAVVSGCGVTAEIQTPVDGESIQLPIGEVLPPGFDGTCFLEGAVITPEFQDLQFSVGITAYLTAADGKPFVPLALPIVTFDEDRVDVWADDAVSIISFDDRKLKISNQAGFSWDPGAPHVLRLLTTGGRTAIGLWSETRKAWSWKL